MRFEWAIQEFWEFVFVLVRTAGILSALPLLGGRMVPRRIKVAMVAATALLLTPVVGMEFDPSWFQPLNLFVGLSTELIVGIVLGLATRLLMAAVETAGSVMGFQVGFGVVGVLDPVTQVQTPVFGQLLTVLATLLYFQLDGHYFLLLALRSSFTLIPPFGAHLHAPLLVDVVQMVQTTLATAVKLALPVMAAVFFVHLTLGVLGRVVPQMNILLTSFPLTISVGLFVLGLGLPLMAMILQEAILGMELVVWDLLKEMGRG